jgi:hypothetical protein
MFTFLLLVLLALIILAKLFDQTPEPRLGPRQRRAAREYYRRLGR